MSSNLLSEVQKNYAAWRRHWTKNCDKTMLNNGKTTGKTTENIDMPLTMYRSNQLQSTGHVTCYSIHVVHTKKTNSNEFGRFKVVNKSKQTIQLTVL